MKGFRLCNHNLDNWIESKFHNAIDVVGFIERENLSTYSIEWKTPVTGAWHTLLIIENGVKIYETASFRLPTVFKKLGV